MKYITCLLAILILLTGCTAFRQQCAIPPDPTESTHETGEEAHIEDTTIPQPETTAALTTILLYVPNENADGFNTVEITGENLPVLEALIQAGVLNEDVQINEYAWSGDTVTIDFNQAFADQICSMGTAGEYMIMGSVVNTMIANNNVTYVQITVNGEILESGHVIYDFPMEFFQ